MTGWSLADWIAVAGALASVAGVVYAVGRASRRLDDQAEKHSALAKEAREGIASHNLRISSLEHHRVEVTVKLDGIEGAVERIENKLDAVLDTARRP